MDADRRFLEVFDLYSDSVYHDASRECTLLLPGLPDGLKRQDMAWVKADCAYRAGEYDEAIKGYEAYMRTYPTGNMSNEALYHLALCYVKLGRTSASLEVLKKVLGDSEDSGVAASSAVRIAELFLKQGDDRNAEKYFLLAYENYPSNAQRDYELISLAWILQKEKKFDSAAQRYDEYYTMFPRSPYRGYAALQEARCLYEAEKYDKASEEIEKLDSIALNESERSLADYLHAASLYQERKYGESERCYNRVLQEEHSASLKNKAAYALGWAYFKEKKYSEAEEQWRECAQTDGDLSVEALSCLSMVQEKIGMIDSAYAAIGRALQNNKGGNAADRMLYQAGMLGYKKGDMAEAQEYFQKISEYYPQSELVPFAQYMRGECNFGAAKYAEAKKYYDTVVQAGKVGEPLRIKSLFKAGLAAYRLSDYRQADSLLTEFAQKYPADSLAGDAVFFCAEANEHLGSFEKAGMLFGEKTKETSGDMQEFCFFRQGLSLLHLQKYEEARSVFQECLTRHSGGKYEWMITLCLADLSSLMNDTLGAINRYRSVLNMTSDSLLKSAAAERIAGCYLKLGDRSEAYKSFQSVLKEYPNSDFAGRSEFLMAWINYRSKEYHDALQDAQAYIRSYPHGDLVPRAWNLIGDCFYNLQQLGDAEQAYRTVVDQYPQSADCPSAVQGLQYCLWAENKKKQALGYPDEFVREHPQSPFVNEVLSKKEDVAFKTKSETEDTVHSTAMLYDLPVFAQNDISISAYSMPAAAGEKEFAQERMLPEQEARNTVSAADTTKENEYNGLADVSIGSYSTPQFSLWYRQNIDNYSLDGKAGYYKTKGFASSTDQSGGNLSVHAKTSLYSENMYLKNAVEDGTLNYATQKFYLYGSALPETARRISKYALSGSIDNLSSTVQPYTLSVVLQATSVTDDDTAASATTTEHLAEAALTVPSTLWGQPIQTQADLILASWGTVYLQCNAGISRYEWQGVYIDASLHLFWLKGKTDQNRLALLPQCRLSYALSPEQTIFASYMPDVDKMTFSRLIETNRYLSTSTLFEHTVVSNRGEIGLESQWNPAIRTRIAAGVESSSNYILFAKDTMGVWNAVPSGRTTLLTFQAEMVAKFTANDYFASGIIFHSMNSSYFGSTLPYSPKFEWNGLAAHSFSSDLKASANFRLLGRRTTEFGSDDHLPAFFVVNISGEYALLRTLQVRLDVMNVTDTRYALWDGYQEFPFTCAIGLRYWW
jgi:TolA-binding protein